MVEEWSRLESEVVDDYHVFRLRQDHSRSPETGETYHFYVLEAPDWINVIPVTAEGQVILIRQYRHGTREVSLEIPGGMVDAEDGAPATAAERELLEETGYQASEMILLGHVTPNPAILNNRCYTYLATDVKQVVSPQFDSTEYIELALADLAQIPDLISSGQITHALVIAAFYHYEQYKNSRAEQGAAVPLQT
jgi:8-oxo-dGTP pyrophosphatase MutT (NUDIX family)